MGRKMNFFLNALLVLLFIMGLNTCSFASVTKDYIYYTIENLSLNYDANKSDSVKSTLNSISNDNKTLIYNTLNNYLSNAGLSNLNDNNCSAFILTKGVVFNLLYVFQNSTFPNGYEDLGFLKLNRIDNYYGYISSYSGVTNESDESTIYYCIFTFYYDNPSIYSKSSSLISLKSTDTSTPSNTNARSFSLNSSTFQADEDNSVITFASSSSYNINSIYTIYPWNSNGILGTYLLKGKDGNFIKVVPPDDESGDNGGDTGGGNTGNITNSSGETTGKVDLSGIESGIGNINQNIDKTNEKLDGISGEIGKLNQNLTTVPTLSGENITSSEITDALNFEFAEDPYANFWLQLTTGLSGALTNNVRSIDIQFRGETYKIELDKFAIQTPEFLKSFLAILSTVFIFWKMIKYWKIIIDNITSGNMDEVLEMNEEEGITDLF